VSIEKNKVIVRRLWEEVWNERCLGVCDEIFDPAYAKHEKAWAPNFLAIFPDLHFMIEDMIAERDKVVTRFILTGTHQGEFLGVPATGKGVKLTGTWIHRLADGRIVEGREWGEWNALELLKQLGVTLPNNS